MSAPPPAPSPLTAQSSAASSSSRHLPAWLRTHQKQAALGAAGLAAVVLAMRGKKSAGAPTNKRAAAGINAPAVAGLSGTPPTDYAQQFAALNDEIDSLLNDPQPPATRKPAGPPPAPRPGHQRYTIKRGDTLDKIATTVYGINDQGARRAIKAANPVLWTFAHNARLDHFAGHTLRIPAYHEHKPAPKPKPKPPKRGRIPVKRQPTPKVPPGHRHPPTHLHPPPAPKPPAHKQHGKRRRAGTA